MHENENELFCKYFCFFFFTLHGIVEIEAAYKDEIQAQHFNDSKGKFMFCVGYLMLVVNGDYSLL